MTAETVSYLLDFMGVVISASMVLVGTKLSADKATDKVIAVMECRLEQLEKKQDKHNNIIERTYKLEERASILETKIEELES